MSNWPNMQRAASGRRADGQKAQTGSAKKDSIGGVFFPCDTGDVLEYMLRVNKEIQQLDADFAAARLDESAVQNNAVKLQAYLLMGLKWPMFKNGYGLDNKPKPGEVGWDAYLAGHSSLVARQWTDEVWRDTELYHRKLADYWDLLAQAGGKLTNPRPSNFGCDVKGTAPPDWNKAAKAAAGSAGAAVTVALLGLGAYALYRFTKRENLPGAT